MLDKLCFILTEREKANTLRRRYLARYSANINKLSRLCIKQKHHIKSPEARLLLERSRLNHVSYRRIADLMNDQRGLLRELRKATGATPKYNTNNSCTYLDLKDKSFSKKAIQSMHASYVFETVVLKGQVLNNPYAKELYGQEETK